MSLLFILYFKSVLHPKLLGRCLASFGLSKAVGLVGLVTTTELEGFPANMGNVFSSEFFLNLICSLSTDSHQVSSSGTQTAQAGG